MSKKNEIEFLESVKRYQGIIHKICLIYAGSNENRKDLTQEIIFQLWKSYPKFRKEAAFSTWMYRVALNTAITCNRKKQPEFFELNENDWVINPESSFEVSEEMRILYRAISKLKKIEKGIIFLWLEDNNYNDIADAMGISTNNVSVRLVRIKEKLKKIINEMV